jgi:putative phosphoribosyl transferase
MTPAPDPTFESSTVRVDAGDVQLEGNLAVPDDARGVVLFAHGSGSSRFSRRNRAVAEYLQSQGLGTLLFDLLTSDEEEIDRRTRHLRFDIPMLARRVAGAAQWLQTHEATRRLGVGAFGASTGGGAALLAAADHPDAIQAVVSRGGRPDLAGEALPRVEAPTLLIVGGRDVAVLEMNRDAMAQMDRAEVELEVVPGATHLFEEEGALEEVARLTATHFREHLSGSRDNAVAARETEPEPRREAEVYRTPTEVAALIAEHAEPFGSVDDADLDALLDRIGDARVVCLGEATHGTSEFYRLRARITQALVERKGFRIVAAEADWPDAERVDAYIRHREPREREWEAFARFPTWMWRNEEIADLVEGLRDWNAERTEDDRAGFFGLDLYSLYTSVHEVLNYLEGRDPDLADAARTRYSCLEPFAENPAHYGRAVVSRRYRACEDEAVAMLQDLLRQRLRLTAGGDGARGEAFPFFDAAQNARVVRNAEEYYREMFYGNVSTWNLRDTHMMGTLKSLLRFFGDDSKAVVWAHNSHLGDAAATYKAQRGEINLGHLCRQEYGGATFLVGFGTHTGTVFAADNWGEEGKVKRVRPSHADSYEWLGHESGVENFFLPLRDADESLRHELNQSRLERAIGVIYRPETELQSHYFPAVLPRQFDEWIWIDETNAVTPLGPSHAPEFPRTHPFRLLVD